MSEFYELWTDFTGFDMTPEAFTFLVIFILAIVSIGFLHVMLKIFSRY